MHIYSLYLEEFTIALAPKVVHMCFWTTLTYLLSSPTQIQKYLYRTGIFVRRTLFDSSKVSILRGLIVGGEV